MKIIIIGSGISGITCARFLAERNHQVEIYEKRNHIGGNCYDKKVANINLHQYGPHIFHTKKEKVMQFVNRFTKLNGYRNQVLGKIKNEIIPIPFNFQGIDTFFANQAPSLKKKLQEIFPEKNRISIYQLLQAEDAEVKAIGNFVYKNIFANYTEKMWGMDAKLVPSFVLERVPVSLSYDDYYFHDKFEGIPFQGYTQMMKNMLEHPNIKITLNCDALKHLKVDNQSLYWEKQLLKTPVVYCGSLDQFFNFEFGMLPYRSIFFQQKILEMSQFQNKAVVNYPNHPQMTRITEYKHFLNEKSDWTVITKEYPNQFEPQSQKWSTRYYPLGIESSKIQYKKYFKKSLMIKNFFPLGRLAQYQYLNMDQAIEQALQKSQQILENYEKTS